MKEEILKIGDVVGFNKGLQVREQGVITSVYKNSSMEEWQYMVDYKYGWFKAKELELIK
jgi:uncharacterized protein YkvS